SRWRRDEGACSSEFDHLCLLLVRERRSRGRRGTPSGVADPQQEPYQRPVHHQGGAPVGDERQRDAGQRDESGDAADDHAHLKASPAARSLPKLSRTAIAVRKPRATMMANSTTTAITPATPSSSPIEAVMKSVLANGVRYG